MVCGGLETLTDQSIKSILLFPTTCDYYFYAKIMGAFFIIIAFILYKAEQKKLVKADMISSLGVSALATIFISLIGTLVGFIQADIFIEILVVGIIFITLWIFKK